MPSVRLCILFCFAACVLSSRAAISRGGNPSDADLQFFESRIRPVLAERCFKCHSTKEGKDKGGLTLDSRIGLLKGGDNGVVIAPGEPGKSRLVEAIGYGNIELQMPPKGKLTDSQIADLTEWVKRGAPWPAETAATGSEKPAAPASPAAFDLAKRKAEHWAWQPVARHAAPAVKDANWAKSDVDRFILAKLESAGLKPAAPADKATLIRRAELLLTGLPPTPPEVDAFVADESPDAFAKVVDRLLASPRFGERWARHWLDLVRYAETRGHEFDNDIPNAWQYRDYVIRAFNADVPYDQFVREQIAGDLLPSPRMSPDGRVNESVIGTGFWFLSEWVHSPVDIRQDEADRVDNQIDVFAKTFQAMTVACARCHDHKFDAIATRDYYALAGFLHSSSYRDVAFESADANRQVLKQVRSLDDATRSNVLSTLAEARKPVMERVSQYLLAAAEELRRQKSGAADQGPTVRDLDPLIVAAWVEELKAAKKDALSPLHPFATIATSAAEDLTPPRIAELLKGIAAKPAPWDGGPGASTIVDYANPGEYGWIADGDAFGDGPVAAGTVVVGAHVDRPIARVFSHTAAASGLLAPNLPGMLRTPTFVIDKPWLSFRVWGGGRAFIVIDSHRMVAGPLHGVTKQRIEATEGWHIHSVSLKNYIGQRAHIEFTAAEANERLSIQWVRLSENQPSGETRDNGARDVAAALLAGEAPKSLGELAERYEQMLAQAAELLSPDSVRLRQDQSARPEDKASLARRAMLADWIAGRLDRFGYFGPVRDKLGELFTKQGSERVALLARVHHSATAMAMLDGSPVDEHVLIRGNPKTPGEIVPRRFIEALAGPEPMKIAHGSGRLQLAERIADAKNPLTSRVIVNRVWHHLFGRGIVASVDNFGVLGERPTHPELLDNLADDFVKDGWSIKGLIRRLVLSQTWQMSSRESDEGSPLDPQNLLLHRTNLRRLEAEAIRDQLLFVSGRLDETMYGSSIDVYLTPFMEGRGKPGAGGPLDGAGRRSLYTKIRRNFLPPMMLAFDMPQPFNCMGRRSVSNVPAQALILMNDPFVVQQAELWAKRVLADPSLKTPGERIDRMYRMAFCRPPSEPEREAALEFLERQGAERGIEAGKRASDVRVWADLAHVLVNVKEFIYVP